VIHRSFDASEINPILNDPSVFEAIKLPGMTPDIDVTPIVQNVNNVLLMADGGGIIFAQQEPGIYEVHTSFLEKCRGRNAITASKEAYRWMFTHTDCMILQTKVPAFNKAADLFCKIVGATKDFERKKVWLTESGPVDMSYWSLKYEDWLRQTPSLMQSGKAFHHRLDEERDRLGFPDDSHPDEDCHDLYVGVCAEMIYGGQPEKAVVLYNRWARFSGYEPIALVSKSPLLIDIGTSLLQVQDDSFRIIQCRTLQ
jgi:hypothetical protein